MTVPLATALDLMLAILFMASALAQSPEFNVDLHLDTPTQMLNKGLHLDASSGLEASTPLLRQAGTNVVISVVRQFTTRDIPVSLTGSLHPSAPQLPPSSDHSILPSC